MILSIYIANFLYITRISGKIVHGSFIPCLYLCSMGHAWIGYYGGPDAGDYQWVDGSQNAFTDWENNRPKRDDNDNAATISDKGWKEYQKKQKNRFICEASSCEEGDDVPEDCPHAEEIGDRYFSLIREKRTFDQAEAACAHMGGHLASIHSDDEEEAVNKYLKKSG